MLQRLATVLERDEPLVFAGREPTMNEELPAWMNEARSLGASSIGLVTNGRRLQDPGYLELLVEAGLAAASVKLFSCDPDEHDEACGVPGAWEETLWGIRHLVDRGVATEIRVPMSRWNLDELERYAALGRKLKVRQLRAECSLEGLGLEHLSSLPDALGRLDEACRARGLPLEVEPLEVGTLGFSHMPLPSRTLDPNLVGS